MIAISASTSKELVDSDYIPRVLELFPKATVFALRPEASEIHHACTR